MVAGRAQVYAPFETNRPPLQVAASNGNVTVSWALSSFELELHSNSGLVADGWSLVTTAPEADVDRVGVTLPPSAERSFFRLRGRNFAPLFHFQVFYALDLEIGVLPAFTITGPVHGNSNIYADPHTSLTFAQRVTSAQSIFEDKSPNDPTTRSNGPVFYLGGQRSGVAPLHLAGGTNAWRQILEIPPPDENPTSLPGLERFYNKADLVIRVSNSGVQVTSGRYNGFSTTIATNELSFLMTNATFYNGRENKTVRSIDLDMNGLRQWDATNTVLQPPSGAIRIVYVADERPQTSSTQAGIRLLNGESLLPQGLTVATPNPLYVQGAYNCPSVVHLGTTNTSAASPAALIADAITILSSAWNDTNSTKSLPSRIAVNTTVNAALVGGIVESDGVSYSGGLENLPRFLEEWTGRTFTHNGSMAALFASQQATGAWGNFGTYNPPIRNWSFDTSFQDFSRLPPGTPVVGVLAQ